MAFVVAVSDAVVTGGAALGGAVIGATAGGLVDLLLTRRRERAEARGGARLVQAELSAAASQLEEVAREGKWWASYDMSLPSWDAYRGALAAELTRSEWMTVSQSVVELQGLSAVTKAKMQNPRVMSVGDATIAVARDLRHNATAAYNALCRLAETEGEDLLPGAPPVGTRMTATRDPRAKATAGATQATETARKPSRPLDT